MNDEREGAEHFFLGNLTYAVLAIKQIFPFSLLPSFSFPPLPFPLDWPRAASIINLMFYFTCHPKNPSSTCSLALLLFPLQKTTKNETSGRSPDCL
jgi:hypothetical protein